MKKFGITVFIIAVVIGVAFANIVSFGKIETPGVFDFSFKRGVRGSGNVVSENRQITGFTGVKVGGVFAVEVVAGKDFGVVVEADDNILPLIKTEVKDGILIIRTEQKIRSSKRISVKVSAPDIERLDVGGASKVAVSEINNAKLFADVNGASKLSVSGVTNDLDIESSGASKVDAEQLKAVNANVDASGASRTVVNASGRLKAEASGASRIAYVGSPETLDKQASGAGRVSQKGNE
ncbi:MAG: DUF2807 domain-containing protein [Blastocatellia bacterium]|nr:DUF2807 domain-containing protein [Blastocatellia bacterium]